MSSLWLEAARWGGPGPRQEGAAGHWAVGPGAMAAVAGVQRPRAGLGAGSPKDPAEPVDNSLVYHR